MKDWNLLHDRELLSRFAQIVDPPEVPEAPVLTPQLAYIAHNLALTLKRQLLGTNAPEEKVSDQEILDNFANLKFDPKNTASLGKGAIPLYVSDLKDVAYFNAWLQNNHATAIGQDGKAVPFTEETNADHCVAIFILYQRASRMLANAVPANKELAQYYLDRILEIGKTLTGPDGKACHVTSYGQPYNLPATMAPAGATTDQLQREIVSILPFNVNEVNLTKIKLFADTYAKLAPANAQVTSASQLIDTLISQIGSYMTNKVSSIIPLDNFHTQQIMMMTNNYAEFLHRLYQIVDNARSLYSLFVSENVPQMKKIYPDQAEAIQQQLDPASANVRQIGSAIIEVQNDTKRKIEQSQRRR
jgi:hypothetical protein